MNADKIAAGLRKGLEGVTPGPWCTDRGHSVVGIYGADGETFARTCLTEYWNSVGDEDQANAAHIARCSPDNIAALLDAYDEQKRLLVEAVEAIEGLLAHSGVADVHERDKDADDHDAERFARTLLSKLKEATNGR